MSTLQLDRTDGGVDAMVSEWKVGGEYELRVKVRQTGASESTASFDVIEAVDETSEAPEEELDDSPPAKAPPVKPSKPALTIK